MSINDPLRTLADARYSSVMRALWPIERAVLDATAQDYPASADSIRQQIETAQVTAFENTGAGFFSTVSVPADAPRLPNKSPLDGAHGNVNGVEDGMGFVVFLEDGRLSLVEGYCQAITSTVDIDFATVNFNLRPYSAGYE
jgi:hypothetical protein